MSTQEPVAEQQPREVPYWFIGAIICLIIFIATTLYVCVQTQNELMTSSEPNAGLGIGLVGLGIDLALVVLFFLSILVSFLQKRNAAQFNKYVLISIIPFLIGVGFIYALPSLFPVMYESNSAACAFLKRPTRCYERNAIREKDPSICDKIDYAAVHGSDVATQEIFRKSCYDNVARGHW